MAQVNLIRQCGRVNVQNSAKPNTGQSRDVIEDGIVHREFAVTGGNGASSCAPDSRI